MKELNKILVLVIGGLLTVCTMPGVFLVVKGLDNDTFLVTMSGAYLECNIINASWAIGTVEMSHSYWTNASQTERADTSNSTDGNNLDFEMTVSTDAATWDVNAAPAADKYQMNASSDSWVSEMKFQLTVYGDVKANFAPDDNATFDLRFDSPTSTTTGTQQTITLNGKVTVH
ncbi:MAG: hypothetical protein IMZ58_12255 [Thermoplasmata archaeon]|nr:hypothetical protein [Thermoplasmata archaeon]